MRHTGFLLIVIMLVLGLAMVKLAEAQTLTIEKTWGGTGNDIGRGVAVDASGNVYVTGDTDSFSAGMHNVFLLKYSSAGVLQWQKTWGGASGDRAYGVAVDASGNVYVTGYTWSFGAGSFDVFLLKYSSAGVLQWQKTWGGTSDDEGYGVAVDASGNVYVTGYTWSFGAGMYDVFLLKYSSAGVLQWQKTWGGASGDDGSGVAVDASGNVYVTGDTKSFGAGQGDVFLLKYSSAGVLQWQKTWGGGGNDIGSGVAVDASGNVYVTGDTKSFGAGSDDAFLLKYSSAGVLQWQKTWGGGGNDIGRGVAVDASGKVYVTGYTDSFGACQGDVFLLKYSSAGVLQWQKTWGGASGDDGSGVAVDASGKVYVTGYTFSPSRILQGVSGTENTPAGTENTPAGTENTPAGTENTPAGTENTPAGSETYAGDGDVFLLVFTTAPALTVVSTYGSPSPSGTTTYDSGTSVTASVTSPVAGPAGTQYVCTGWTGTGSVASGTGTSVTFMITQDSSISWNWKTQYQVTFAQTGLSSDASGTVLTANGTAYSYSAFPSSAVWIDDGNTYSFTGTVPAGSGKQYVLTGVTGVSSPVHSGSVSATYRSRTT